METDLTVADKRADKSALDVRREDERAWQSLKADVAFTRRMIWIAAAVAMLTSLIEALPDISKAMTLLLAR